MRLIPARRAYAISPVVNPFALTVHPGADHGFDNADEGEGEDPQAEIDARDAAADATMAALESWLF